VLTYKMAIALRPQICDVTSPYVLYSYDNYATGSTITTGVRR